MRGKGWENRIEKQIKRELEEIEQKEKVRILYAVESGSRAWGFASLDSDYDVRFIYVRPMSVYLELEEKPDFINWKLDKTLDINGWDLSKTLKQFHRSNATLYEWRNSPVIYRNTPEWKKVEKVSKQYFSCKSSMYHYYGTANKNYYAYLTKEKVKLKKYFYVLRPILACQWIEEKKFPPPVRFSDLAEAVLISEKKEMVENLLQRKIQTTEAQEEARIDELNEYLKENLVKYKGMAEQLPEDRNPDWKQLNQVFLEILKEIRLN